MIDGDNEERKQSRNQALALPTSDDDNEIDVIIGEAECPYYDFVCVSDRWMPSQKSLEKAMDSKFEACNVVFGQSGNFMVPWPKKKFKRELEKFIATQPKQVEVTFDLKKIIEESQNTAD